MSFLSFAFTNFTGNSRMTLKSSSSRIAGYFSRFGIYISLPDSVGTLTNSTFPHNNFVTYGLFNYTISTCHHVVQTISSTVSGCGILVSVLLGFPSTVSRCTFL